MDKATRKFLDTKFHWEEIFLCDGMPIYLMVTGNREFEVFIPPCPLFPNGFMFVFSTSQAAFAFIAFIRSQISLMIYLEELLAFQETIKNQDLLRFFDEQLSSFLEMLKEQERALNEQFLIQSHTPSSPRPGM